MRAMRDYAHLAVLSAMVHDETEGRVTVASDGTPELRYVMSDADREQLTRGLELAADAQRPRRVRFGALDHRDVVRQAGEALHALAQPVEEVVEALAHSSTIEDAAPGVLRAVAEAADDEGRPEDEEGVGEDGAHEGGGDHAAQPRPQGEDREE